MELVSYSIINIWQAFVSNVVIELGSICFFTIFRKVFIILSSLESFMLQSSSSLTTVSGKDGNHWLFVSHSINGSIKTWWWLGGWEVKVMLMIMMMKRRRDINGENDDVGDDNINETINERYFSFNVAGFLLYLEV